ncbi:NAC domain-containing protein 53 [Cardamine amara subsp. amara]|uniref:NAC domain-containing protein 53 n=1 Tax=Cardamine amara subsp. amara TaxID=228776 RepID=A0ABD0YZE7_CARAN
MGRGSVTSLAPGFRFHPTDEELVRYYLKRKICNKPFKFDAISVTDVYKSEPWDLPDKSKLKSRDLEWYFFSVLDKKYRNGSKTNRATEKGYWKTTGKDREIRNGSSVVGMKKTLVYHKGRALRGERTNWVMHEYRLVYEDLEKTGVQQDAYVLCRIFQKSGSGPKNGEQYGAPFVEEEWEEEDDMTFVPDQDLGSEDHVYVHMDEIDQKPENFVVYDAIPIPLNLDHGESSNNAEPNYSDFRNYIQPRDSVDSGSYFERPAESSEKDQKPTLHDDSLQNDLLLQDEEIGCGVQDEHTENLQSSDNIFGTDTSCYNDFPVESNYFTGEAFLDPNSNLLQNDGLYLETNDLSSTQQDGFDFEDYLTFFDEDDENAENLTFDPSQLMGNEDFFTDQEELFQQAESKELEKEETSGGKQVVEEKVKDEASCSKQVDADGTDFEPDYKYPLLKKASHMLGAIPAPPAFASEFPSKDATIRLHAGQPSGLVHVTASMITISDSNMGWSYSKNGNLDLIPFGLVQENASEKSGNSLTRAMLIFMCFWVFVLSVSFKVTTLVSSR